MAQEFDRFAPTYQESLRDPLREAFAPGAEFFLQRKLDMLLRFAARQRLDTCKATLLDVGCGTAAHLVERHSNGHRSAASTLFSAGSLNEQGRRPGRTPGGYAK